MTVLQSKETWLTAGRWSDEVVDNWFKTKLKNDVEVGLGFSHEEPLTNLLRNFVSSAKDLPFAIYQIQSKFRNEARAKSGILRGREFLMKDMYSFSRTEEEHNAFYEKATQAYKNVFNRLGIGDRTHLTFASGGVFSKFSHEFQTVTDAGEDLIYMNKEKGVCVNKEVLLPEVLKDLGVSREDLTEMKAIEVGNIFHLQSRFSDAAGLSYVDSKNEKHPIIMGCYGIGISRAMGAIVEALADDKGLVWPKAIAPFKVHLIAIAGKSGEKVSAAADKLYADFQKAGVEVLYDDRDMSAGAKLGDADLIGIPTRIVVSEKTLEKDSVEIKDRATGEVTMAMLAGIVATFAG